EPAGRLAGDLDVGDLLLQGLELGLHLLCPAHQAHEVLHRVLRAGQISSSSGASMPGSGSGSSASGSSASPCAAGRRTSITFAPGKADRMAATAGSARASVIALSRCSASCSDSVGPPCSLDNSTIQLRPVHALSLLDSSLSSVRGASVVRLT